GRPRAPRRPGRREAAVEVWRFTDGAIDLLDLGVALHRQAVEVDHAQVAEPRLVRKAWHSSPSRRLEQSLDRSCLLSRKGSAHVGWHSSPPEPSPTSVSWVS